MGLWGTPLNAFLNFLFIVYNHTLLFSCFGVFAMWQVVSFCQHGKSEALLILHDWAEIELQIISASARVLTVRLCSQL